ncbi:hypothetical protein, partial [Pseudomonas putida]|uniref:hypothetical protein n=1 Tax=Pseudomonas putida TaxID=303 RepID=UPI003AF3CCEC
STSSQKVTPRWFRWLVSCGVCDGFFQTEPKVMSHKLDIYGVSIVKRPKVKAIKKLDLGGDLGKQIVYSETKLVLRTHKKTFQKLADM